MLLKKDLSQCKDLRTVEHLAQQFGWYAAAWTPQEPHLICSDEQFTEFAKALGKLAVTQDGENLLYFLALAAETAQERKNRTMPFGVASSCFSSSGGARKCSVSIASALRTPGGVASWSLWQRAMSASVMTVLVS